jgi:hypothetical protein
MIPQTQQQPMQYFDPELATEKMTQFLQIMARFKTLTWDNIDNIVTVGVWDAKERDFFFADSIKYRRDNKTPQERPNLAYDLRSAVSKSFHIAEQYGGSSGIASMVFDSESTYDDYHIYNQDLIIENIDEGSFGRVSGPPRKGKTSTACVMIERWIDSDNLCFTNIYMKKKVEKISYVNDARTLLAEIANSDGKFIFVYDEGQASGYSTSTATSLESRYTDNLFRVIGKLMGNVIYIDQIEWKAPNVIKEWSMTQLRITDTKGEIMIDINEPVNFHKLVRGFPKTTLPFMSRDIASFNMNVNVERMFQLMSGKPEKQKDIILEFLESPESDPENRKDLKKKGVTK